MPAILHFIRRKCVIAFLVLAACIIPAFADGATWYVAPTGSDSNPGTIDQPYATPHRALETAAAGDTIYLRGGTYTITRPVIISLAGITLSSYPGEHAAITGSIADTTTLTSIVIEYASNVTIANLEIEGASYYGIKLDNAYGPQSGIRISNCYIHGTGRDAIKTQDSDGLVIENNELAFTGMRDPTNADGIDVIGSLGLTIRANYIHDIATNGLYIKGGSVNGIVENNRIERTGYSGLLLGSETDRQFMRNGAVFQASNCVARNNIVVDAKMSGIGTIGGDNVRFENNTVVRAASVGQAGFRAAPDNLGTSPGQVVMENNVISLDPASGRPLVALYDFTGTLTADNNVYFSPAGTYRFWQEYSGRTSYYYSSLATWQSGMNVDWHSLAADPQLDANNLWAPLAGSPAIDAGISIAEVPTDYDGTARPQGAAYDVGAHEVAAQSQQPLGAPTNLVASAQSTNAIALTWTDNASAEGAYIVERSADGMSFQAVATLGPNTTTYSDANLPAATTFWYRVKATSSLSDSGYSNTASATTLAPAAPSAPTSLKATAVSGSQIGLAWSDQSANEDGFVIEQSSDRTTFVLVATVPANTTNYASTGLQAGRAYYYRVAAYNGAGISGYSNVSGARTRRK